MAEPDPFAEGFDRPEQLREFYAERDVVHEERRLRTESTPTGIFQEQFDAMFWQSSPYHWPVIGWLASQAGAFFVRGLLAGLPVGFAAGFGAGVADEVLQSVFGAHLVSLTSSPNIGRSVSSALRRSDLIVLIGRSRVSAISASGMSS